MYHRTLAALTALALSLPLFGCEQIADVLPDLSLGKDDGIPPIQGSTTIDVPQDYQCGDPIQDPNMRYEVTSTGTAEKCTFRFKQDVTALKSSDYASQPGLEGAQFVSRVDIDVNQLAVRDGATNQKLEPLDLNGTAFGETILTKADLAQSPPFTKSVTGKPIDELQALVKEKKDIVIPVEVTIDVSLAPMPPAKIALDFDAQPNIVFGF